MGQLEFLQAYRTHLRIILCLLVISKYLVDNYLYVWENLT